MANEVYANTREISCKAGNGKSICAFPDVCMTPPENPATPPGIPVPYPNTGLASDTTDGSKSVTISGKEIMLKNKSYFKQSMGDEAGCAAKKGVISSVNRGKVYFIAWSMDVKAEGENVVRHLDMTTHNHASPVTNAPPTVHIDGMAFQLPGSCDTNVTDHNNACKGAEQSHRRSYTQAGDFKGWEPAGLDCSKAKDPEKCKKAKACLLMPKKQDKKFCCKEDTTGHHLIEDHWVNGRTRNFPMAQENAGYNAAPTVCAGDDRYSGKHGVLHGVQGAIEESYMSGGARRDSTKANGGWNYGAGKEAAITAHQEAFGAKTCSAPCLEAQLDKFYGSDPGRSLNAPETQPLKERQRNRYEPRFSAPSP